MLKEKVRELEQLLHVGNFAGAQPLVAEMRTTTLRGQLGRLEPGTTLRMRATGAMAEVLFYLGQNAAARDLVRFGASRAQWVMFSNDVSARARLQRVEYDYSRREFALAKSIATQTQRQCEELHDALGAAEALAYLARCEMRLHDPVARS